MTQAVQNTSNNVAPVVSLTARVKNNLNNRKVEVIGSGVTTAVLAGGIAAAALFGPITLIAGLAVATFMALALFLTSLASKPKNVTKQEPVVQKQEEPVVAAPAVVQVEQPAQKAVEKQSLLSSTKNYVMAHPYKTILGTAAVVGAGYGLYTAYNAYTAAAGFGPVMLLSDKAANTIAPTMAPKWNVCPAVRNVCAAKSAPLAEAAKFVHHPVRVLPNNKSTVDRIVSIFYSAFASVRDLLETCPNYFSNYKK